MDKTEPPLVSEFQPIGVGGPAGSINLMIPPYLGVKGAAAGFVVVGAVVAGFVAGADVVAGGIITVDVAGAGFAVVVGAAGVVAVGVPQPIITVAHSNRIARTTNNFFILSSII